MKNQLTFAHIGDLHITKAREQNYIDFLSIVAQIETECSHKLDFVFLPGDNADNGLPQQYKLVETALKMLSIPVQMIAGDHDMEQGSLDNYHKMRFTRPLPYSSVINNYRCIFIDVSGRGKGGPDFRLLDEQLNWLEKELHVAGNENMRVVLFMHTYPADMKDSTEIAKLNQLIADNKVILVDMGHTHYNELSNDGHTIFSATRSTGQIEEGPVGYSLITIDNGTVSWRFKPLDDPFPFVMITAPVDYRLIKDEKEKIVDIAEIHATVFGSRDLKSVHCKVGDNDDWLPMTSDNGKHYKASVNTLPDTAKVTFTVEATDETGRPGRHSIIAPGQSFTITERVQDGSNHNVVEAWPENGIFGTQLGPNQNGKPSS